MPNFPQPQRQDEPVVTDGDLAALLAGTTDAAAGLRPVADVLAALTAEPSDMELAGEGRALAEFRRRAGARAPAHRARRGTAGLNSRFGVKVGASVTAAVVVLGGGAAAAFADVLPAPIQRLAHEAIGAPFPQPRPDLPSRGRPRTHSPSGVYGRSGMRGKPAARGGPGAKQARPHATPTPTAHTNPQGQGKHGNPHGKGKGKEGQGNGQGQGNGRGHGNGKAQSSGKAHGSGKAQGNGQSNGQRQPWKPHKWWRHASSRIGRRLAGHPRWFIRIRLLMDP